MKVGKRVSRCVTMLSSILCLSVLESFGDTPDEYVRCVESDGSQWVDLQIVGKGNMRYEVDVLFLSTDNSVLLGCQGPTATYWPFCSWYGFRTRYYGFGNTARAEINDRFRAEVVMENGFQNIVYHEYHGRAQDAPNEVTGDADTGRNLFLFASNGLEAPECFCKAQVFGLKIWSMSEGEYRLVRDLRPCVKNGRAGLHDSVEDTIFYSGSGTDLIVPKVWELYPETRMTGGEMLTSAQQAIRAFSNARTSDTILFKPGTYVFGAGDSMSVDDVGGIKATNRMDVSAYNLLVRGETPTSRKYWNIGAEPVILDGNGARLFRIQTQYGTDGLPLDDATFENLALVNCDASAGDSTWTETFRGGAICSVKLNWYQLANPFVTNCVFRANSAWCCGAAYGGTFSDCLFLGNSCSETGGSYGGIVYTVNNMVGCDFVENTCHWRTAALFMKGTRLSDCSFIGNVASNGWVNAAVYAENGLEISGCHFVSNVNQGANGDGAGALRIVATYQRMTESGGLRVSDCVFDGNVARGESGTPHGGAAKCAISDVPEGCDGRDVCVFTNCIFRGNRCMFTGGLYGGTAVSCRFVNNAPFDSSSLYLYGGDAENCKLYGCDLTGGEISDCVLVGCHVHGVTNRFVFTQDKQFGTFATNCLIEACRPSIGLAYASVNLNLVNCSLVANTNDLFSLKATSYRMVNSFFYDNVSSYVGKKAISISADPNEILFVNCAYGPEGEIGGLVGTDIRYVADARLNKGRYSEWGYYAPKPKSPLLGWGLPLDYDEFDVDIAGQARLRAGRVDIGCYSGIVIDPSGFAITVR